MKAIKSAQQKQAFAILDDDKSGMISRDEFISSKLGTARGV